MNIVDEKFYKVPSLQKYQTPIKQKYDAWVLLPSKASKLQPLRDLFPNFYTKEMLASEELLPLLRYSSRLAAIDYIVSDASDVFVTNNKGNMAKILVGRRRYLGHKRTIRPNAKKLSSLFMARKYMDWDTFSRKVKSCQGGFMGEPEEMRPGRGEFHEFPASCICKRNSYNDDSDYMEHPRRPNTLDWEEVVKSQNRTESTIKFGKSRLKGVTSVGLNETRVSWIRNREKQQLLPN